MKKNIQLFLMSILFFMASDAQAQERYAQDSCCYEDNWCVNKRNFYARIMAGPNFLQNTKVNRNKSTYHTGYVISGSLGFNCGCGIRLEAEYAYRRNAIGKIHFFQECSSRNGHFQTSSCMANLLWDMPLSSCRCSFWKIQPFFGAGVGCDFQQMRSTNSRIIFNQRWNHFSWQVMAGIGYTIFCNTDITLEYIFHQGGCRFNNHSFGVGLVFKFNIR